MLTATQWQDVCKFFSGAFFIGAVTSFYLYLACILVLILGTGLSATPMAMGVRSIIYGILFLVFFYVGFIRKGKSSSIS